MTRQSILTALEKYTASQQAGRAMAEENGLHKRLIQALEMMGNVSMMKGEKGDSIVGPRGPKGDSIVGPPGPPGKDAEPIELKELVEEMAIDGRFKGETGEPGADGNANMAEVISIASDESEMAVNAHERKHDHALIHDSKKLGDYELDTSTLQEGEILQVKGKKIVGTKIVMPDMNGLRGWVSSQGVSNFKSYSVTSSQTIDAMAIYVIDASAGDITITVPSAAGRENFWFELIRIDSSANTVTVVPTGSETLSGETSYLLQQWTDLRIFAHNNSYLIRSAG